MAMLAPLVRSGSAPKGIWLNLSGGGFRAALFHYGCLRRLHEVDLAWRVEGISATSGGAIVAALWAMNNERHDGNPDEAWRRFEADVLRLVSRGVLGPMALLVTAYVFYATGIVVGVLTGFGDEWALAPFVAGLATHLSLVAALVRDGGRPADGQGTEFVRALLAPSRTRWYTMDLRVFQGYPLTDLGNAPLRVFFNAVNLEQGRQSVLGAQIESGLELSDLRRQWKSKTEAEGGWRIGEGTPLVAPVAASTAFPPWFRPVPLVLHRGDETVVRHFLDGGVTDNAAFKLARGLATNSGSHGFLRRYGWDHWSFDDIVGLVLTIDASRPPDFRSNVRSRVRGSARLARVAQNAQGTDLEAATESLRSTGVDALNIGLQVGYPDGELESVSEPITRIRTHLDGFTSTEIAAVAYCGYSWIDYLVTGGHFASLLSGKPTAAVSTWEGFAQSLGCRHHAVDVVTSRLRRGSRVVSLWRYLERWRERPPH